MASGKMETLGTLQRFRDSMAANVTELTPYEGSRLKLDGLVTTAQGLTQQQAALTAAKQEASKQLQDVLDQALRLATVLRFAIRAHYGRDAEKLVEFGLKPFRGQTRKPTPEAPPEPPIPPVE